MGTDAICATPAEPIRVIAALTIAPRSIVLNCELRLVGRAREVHSDGVIGIAEGGVFGTPARSNAGVFGPGRIAAADAVLGLREEGFVAGVRGEGLGLHGIAVAHNGPFARGVLGFSRTGQAGRFLGNVEITGPLKKQGAHSRLTILSIQRISTCSTPPSNRRI
jgi:hypothetical protein